MGAQIMSRVVRRLVLVSAALCRGVRRLGGELVGIRRDAGGRSWGSYAVTGRARVAERRAWQARRRYFYLH